MGIRSFVQHYKKFFSAAYTPKPSSTEETSPQQRWQTLLKYRYNCSVLACYIESFHSEYFISLELCNFRLALWKLTAMTLILDERVLSF